MAFVKPVLGRLVWIGASLLALGLARELRAPRLLLSFGLASLVMALISSAWELVKLGGRLARRALRRRPLAGTIVLLVLVAGAVTGVYLTLTRPPVGRAIELGVAAADVGEWDLALAYLSDAQRQQPGSPRIMRLLGVVNGSAGGRDLLAMAWLHASLAASPNAGDAATMRREIAELERRARRALDETLEMLRASAEGAGPELRVEAEVSRAAVAALLRMSPTREAAADPAIVARVDAALTASQPMAFTREEGEAAAWVRLINERLIGRPAVENLTAVRATLAGQDRDGRVRLLAKAAHDLATGLRAIRDLESAWRTTQRATQ